MGPILIGICGGSASGKTTLSRFMCKKLGEQNCQVIALDSYYRNLLDTAKRPEDINFDHPNSLDLELLNAHLTELKAGNDAEIPVYDFSVHQRMERTVRIRPRKYLVVEGLFLFNLSQIEQTFQLKLYVDTPEEERFRRRVQRDLKSRNRSLESIAEQYHKTVKPMFEKFVKPNRPLADLVIDGSKDFEMQWSSISTLLKAVD